MLRYIYEGLLADPKCYLVEELLGGDNGWDSGSFHKVPVDYPELTGLYRRIKDLVNVRVIKGISDESINPQLGIKILGGYFTEGVAESDDVGKMSDEELDVRIKELWGVLYGK